MNADAARGRTAPAPTEPSTPDAADLCTSCGLCCDGTLFDRAKAYDSDRPGLAAHGLPVIPNGTGIAFSLPCLLLDDTCCTIYADRFVTCHKFRCELLKKLDSGAIDLARGRATIANARTLIAAVEPEARTLGGRIVRHQATSGWQEIADLVERVAAARKQLAIVALERYLSAHFRKPREQAAQE